MFRYYLLERPAGPGAIPGWMKPTKVCNFPTRTFIPGVGYTWGYVEYDRPLDPKDEYFYELRRKVDVRSKV